MASLGSKVNVSSCVLLMSGTFDEMSLAQESSVEFKRTLFSETRYIAVEPLQYKYLSKRIYEQHKQQQDK